MNKVCINYKCVTSYFTKVCHIGRTDIELGLFYLISRHGREGMRTMAQRVG